jgi:DNA mismatch repair protein MutS
LAALHATEHEAGLALLDVTTGTFYAWQGSHASIERALAGFGPSELVYNRRDNSPWVQSMRDRHVVYGLEEWIFQPAEAQRRLSEQFGPHAIKGFGLDADPLAVVAAGVVLHYLDQTQYTHTGHLTGITRWREDSHLWMDAFTVRNLELFRTASEGGTALVDVVDACRGPMGARLLRRWLAFPLTDRAELEARHSAVAFAQSDRAWAHDPDARRVLADRPFVDAKTLNARKQAVKQGEPTGLPFRLRPVFSSGLKRRPKAARALSPTSARYFFM